MPATRQVLESIQTGILLQSRTFDASHSIFQRLFRFFHTFASDTDDLEITDGPEKKDMHFRRLRHWHDVSIHSFHHGIAMKSFY